MPVRERMMADEWKYREELATEILPMWSAWASSKAKSRLGCNGIKCRQFADEMQFAVDSGISRCKDASKCSESQAMSTASTPNALSSIPKTISFNQNSSKCSHQIVFPCE